MRTFFLAIVGIAFSVAAQFSLKAGMSDATAKVLQQETNALRSIAIVLSNKYVVGGLILYGLGAIVWLAVLSKWDVSKAYPLVGFGFVITAAVGFYVGEAVTLVRVIGILMVTAGVVLISQS